MIRVLVADDHAMVREMLRIALPRISDIEVVGEAGNGREVAAAIYRCKPDVVLLDYKMPYVKSFGSLIGEVLQCSPEMRVVVLSGFGTREIAASAAAAGACGYVLKSTRLQAVGDAIRTVMRGGTWIDANLPREIFETFQRESARSASCSTGLTALTRREHEVLACVADGNSNRAIAQKLNISEKTVKTHLTSVFMKLEVKNRVGAILIYCAGAVRRFRGDGVPPAPSPEPR